MKIQELINSYDSFVKEAFIPNPEAQQQDGQLEQAYQQLSQALSSVPPEVQGQIEPMLQQLQQLPPQEQLGQINELIQQLGQGAGGQPGAEQTPAAPEQAAPEGDGMVPTEGHVNAENSLDNTKVTLSVRELLDLSSGGKATQSLLKVKQMAEAHNKKMESVQQQAEQDQVAQQQEQQQQAAMGQGGIYSQPMNANAKPGAAAQPAM
jgi:hypothetical protein